VSCVRRLSAHAPLLGRRSVRCCAILRNMHTSTQGLPARSDTHEQRVAARVRAALAYSGLRNPEVLERMGGVMSDATLRRITSAAHPRGASADELKRLADACGVPLSWLELGEWRDEDNRPLPVIEPHFDADASTVQRLETLEHYVATLLRIEQRRYGAGLPIPQAESPARSPRPRAHRTTHAADEPHRGSSAGDE
jgi:transcriptional regulator with XRE-family HTH domain